MKHNSEHQLNLFGQSADCRQTDVAGSAGKKFDESKYEAFTPTSDRLAAPKVVRRPQNVGSLLLKAKQYDRFIVDGKEMLYMGFFEGYTSPKEYCFRVVDDQYITVHEIEVETRIKVADK